jgi:ribonuclease HII
MLIKSFQQELREAGVDEAGRGALAGPVVAAAVIFPIDFENELINDSKKLNAKNRTELKKIIENSALAYGLGVVDEKIIDKINILQSSFLAMHKAIGNLNPSAEFLLIDGNKFKPFRELKFETIIKGDSLYLNIASASILAKVHRDEIMIELSKKFPEYGFEQNKGYATKKHIQAIDKYGLSPVHRKSFKLKRQLKIDFGD